VGGGSNPPTRFLGNLKILEAQGSTCLSVRVIPFIIVHAENYCFDVTDALVELIVELLHHVRPFAMLGRKLTSFYPQSCCQKQILQKMLAFGQRKWEPE
jgi:hypothetical protein